MSKETVNIKSNGLRNELKEIRKAIDRLTNAIEAQTHTHMKTFIILLGMMLMISCVSTKQLKQQKLENYKLMTKDVCRDNPGEVKLAQILYITYLRS